MPLFSATIGHMTNTTVTCYMSLFNSSQESSSGYLHDEHLLSISHPSKLNSKLFQVLDALNNPHIRTVVWTPNKTSLNPHSCLFTSFFHLDSPYQYVICLPQSMTLQNVCMQRCLSDSQSGSLMLTDIGLFAKIWRYQNSCGNSSNPVPSWAVSRYWVFLSFTAKTFNRLRM